MHDPIKQKIIELSPYDLGEYSKCMLCHNRYCTCSERLQNGDWGDRQIGIADVLRAMQKIRSSAAIGVDYNGSFLNCDRNMQNLTTSDVCWNLTTDYDGQTQEVKNFIGKLLGVADL